MRSSWEGTRGAANNENKIGMGDELDLLETTVVHVRGRLITGREKDMVLVRGLAT